MCRSERNPRMIFLWACLLIVALPVSAHAEYTSITTAYYTDTRDFNNLTVYVASDRLPVGLSMWGMADLLGAQSDPDQLWNMTRSYNEFRLDWARDGGLMGVKGFGLQAEYNDMIADGNQLVRIGLKYHHALPVPPLLGEERGWLIWRVHPWESDEEGGQASLAFRLPLGDRMHIVGFADWNYHPDGSDRWVIEPQLNIFLRERMWLAVEFRYNGYEEAISGLDGTGWAFGLSLDF